MFVVNFVCYAFDMAIISFYLGGQNGKEMGLFI
jgi:hypothetical protein